MRNESLHTLLSFLKASAVEFGQAIYAHNVGVSCVYSALSDLSQALIGRLVFVDTWTSLEFLETWLANQEYEHCDLGAKKLLGNVLRELKELHIIVENDDLTAVKLLDVFTISIRRFFMKPLHRSIGLVVVKPDKKFFKSKEDLVMYGEHRWESVLNFLVAPDENVQVSSECKNVLMECGYIKESGMEMLEVTPVAFKFLLKEQNSQLWEYLFVYISYLQKRGMNISECLAFLLQLSFSKFGEAYSSNGFSEAKQTFLQHLREVGIVFQKQRKAMTYFPTPLISSMFGYEAYRKAGCLVVETNFRIYAYTSSNLSIALISIFADLIYRFPNLVAGVLSRDSTRNAFQAGITADEIIKFIEANVHPNAAQQPLPPNVIDQLRLWELERQRFTFQDSVLYSQFEGSSDYNLVTDYATLKNAVVWQPQKNELGLPSTLQLAIDLQQHEHIKKFWKKHKNDAQSHTD